MFAMENYKITSSTNIKFRILINKIPRNKLASVL